MIHQNELLKSFSRGLIDRHDVEAIVLFGSMSRRIGSAGAADGYSDIDLHVITLSPTRLEKSDWAEYAPSGIVSHKCIRTAIGGVKKVTLLYREGEVDLVILPRKVMRFARLCLRTGLAKRMPLVAVPLNKLATIMSGGYTFLKGANEWSRFYSQVVDRMPGYRIDDIRAAELADAAVCDLLWIFRKVERGELIAAQRILHRCVLETNIELLHELRSRRGEVTFQQARRVELLVPSKELRCISLNAERTDVALRNESIRMYHGLRYLMSRLAPDWSVSNDVEARMSKLSSSALSFSD